MDCSWDAGERDREQKLTNISMWRQLNESDLQQYIASSDSEEEEEEGFAAEAPSKANRAKKYDAWLFIRGLLLQLLSFCFCLTTPWLIVTFQSIEVARSAGLGWKW